MLFAGLVIIVVFVVSNGAKIHINNRRCKFFVIKFILKKCAILFSVFRQQIRYAHPVCCGCDVAADAVFDGVVEEMVVEFIHVGNGGC